MSQTKELTNALLKEKLIEGMVYRGVAGVIESCTSFGIWSLDATSSTTEPEPLNDWNYGWLEVMKRGGDLVQRMTHVDGGFVFERVYRRNAWKPWYRITMTKIT